MSDPAAEESFRVTDRRRRADAPEDPARASPRKVADAPGGGPVREPSPHPPGAPVPSAPGERSLVGLFLTLGRTAAVALGAPDPVSGASRPDPPQAAEVIELLILLRDKTAGSLTVEETQILDGLIYDLQLQYVDIMKRPG